ncbi:hypothetical protein K1719_022717 [Acacia pycnantha]|nr:hypothetical protein K1719_022717 [Acacia pycnantha]
MRMNLFGWKRVRAQALKLRREGSSYEFIASQNGEEKSVPADMLISPRSAIVNEAIVTGEPTPQWKVFLCSENWLEGFCYLELEPQSMLLKLMRNPSIPQRFWLPLLYDLEEYIHAKLDEPRNVTNIL